VRSRFLAAGAGAAAALLAGRRPAFAQAAPLKIAAGQIAPQSQAYFAQDMGFFQAHGLSTTVSVFRGGAANAAAVAGGDMQIGVSSILQLAQAHAHGLPFVIIAPGGIHDSRFPGSGLMVAASSPYTSAKELSGKVIAASSLNGLDELAARALIDRRGGDSSSAKFLEIPPSAQLAALLQGRIDAVNMEDPERQAALDGGKVRSLGDGEDAIAKGFAETGWFVTADWLAANKETARRYAQAMYESAGWAMQNPVKAAQIMATYLKSDPVPTRQRYAERMILSDFQSVLDVAARYKFVPPTTATSFVWDGS
jgi:NitT/TauT family transport system substrate-binding protein